MSPSVCYGSINKASVNVKHASELVLLDAGLKLSEFLAITVADIQDERGYYWRIITRLQLAETDLVFNYQGNKTLDPSTVTHTFSKVLEEAALPHLRFHDLTHTHATFLLQVVKMVATALRLWRPNH